MGLGDLIKGVVDKVIETGEDIISRPEKNPDGSKGQAPPGSLTKNVQGKNGMEKFTPLLGLNQSKPGALTSNVGGDLGFINSGNEANPQSFYKNHADDISIIGTSVDGITPDELTNNIGNNDLEDYSVPQAPPGILTSNINGITEGIIEGYEETADDIVNLGSSATGSPVVDPITEDELTPNIGNDLGLNHSQTPAGDLSDNINNIIINDYNTELQQDDPGELTSNIANPLINENDIEQENPGELTPNIANPIITDGDFTQDLPGFLTPNIGNDLLGDSKRFDQKDPGLLTGNIASQTEYSPANAVIQDPRFEQDEPGELTPNIGNDIMDDTLWEQGTPDITPNIGNSEMNNLLWEQDEPGILTPNIVNDIEPVFEQEDAGIPTTNVGNELGETHEQLIAGKLTENIGNDLGSYEQLDPGVLTNNVGNNDIEEYGIEQSDAGKLTSNIGNKVIQDGTRIEQEKAGKLTSNIGNKSIREQQIEQIPVGELTNNVGNNDLDSELFNNEPRNANIGNDLEPTYVNPEIKERNNDLGVNHEQLDAGELTENVAPKTLKGTLFENEPENQNVGNDLREQYENPAKVQKQPTIDQLFENPEVRRQVELDTIQNQMRNRTNIGTDLGKLF